MLLSALASVVGFIGSTAITLLIFLNINRLVVGEAINNRIGSTSFQWHHLTLELPVFAISVFCGWRCWIFSKRFVENGFGSGFKIESLDSAISVLCVLAGVLVILYGLFQYFFTFRN